MDIVALLRTTLGGSSVALPRHRGMNRAITKDEHELSSAALLALTDRIGIQGTAMALGTNYSHVQVWLRGRHRPTFRYHTAILELARARGVPISCPHDYKPA